MSALTRFCEPEAINTDNTTTVLGDDFTSLLWKVFVAIGTHSNPQAPNMVRHHRFTQLIAPVL